MSVKAQVLSWFVSDTSSQAVLLITFGFCGEKYDMVEGSLSMLEESKLVVLWRLK